MNNKLVFTGGEPNMTEDDFLRIQQSNRLGLHGLTKALSPDPFIVSGCDVTDNGTDIDVTAGYIFFGGLLIQVDAHNAVDTAGNGFYRYEISTTFEAGGDKTYQDSSPRQTWEKKRGIATSVVAIVGGDLDVKAGVRFDDLINNLIDAPTAWASVTPGSGFIHGTSNCMYRRLSNGTIEMRGVLIRATPSASTLMFTLPVGFRIGSNGTIAASVACTNVGYTVLAVIDMQVLSGGAVILLNNVFPALTYFSGEIFFNISFPSS